MALGGVALLNYWASFQLLSTLVYTGVAAALLGAASLAVPFRFMGVRRRAVGALGLAGGVGLALVALHWPAATTRVAQPRTRLDDVMPEYQFSEVHALRVLARTEQVMHAPRESTFGDMTSLAVLLKVPERSSARPLLAAAICRMSGLSMLSRRLATSSTAATTRSCCSEPPTSGSSAAPTCAPRSSSSTIGSWVR
ncbi:MAG TPA: hypothetical protein VMT70_24855 [Vicinamibacteria bacterium]|nr:hypothetical protein [Vicinamibacteria bacterium]